METGGYMGAEILSEHRQRIDQLDEKLIRLLAERFEITKAVGILKAIPVSLPLSSGITFPTAIAAPVDEGIILLSEDLPSL